MSFDGTIKKKKETINNFSATNFFYLMRDFPTKVFLLAFLIVVIFRIDEDENVLALQNEL